MKNVVNKMRKCKYVKFKDLEVEKTKKLDFHFAYNEKPKCVEILLSEDEVIEISIVDLLEEILESIKKWEGE